MTIRVNDTRIAALRDNVGTRGFTVSTDTVLDLINDLVDARKAVVVMKARLDICVEAGQALVATIQELEQDT